MATYIKKIIPFFLMLLNFMAASQPITRTITGLITSLEEGTPLEGASVFVKGSNRYSGSQADGIYYINITPGDSILVFSYNEFETQEVKISNSSEYNIGLRRSQPRGSSFNPYGNWRGVFMLRDSIEVPFQFEIKNDPKGYSKIYFLNAEEQFEGGAVTWTNDSLLVSMNQFDNELALKIENNWLTGVLRKQDKTGSPIRVKVERGKANRFTIPRNKPVADISGTYAITFKSSQGKDENAIGLFTQDGVKLRATFLRVTGDSRFLDGIVSGSEFYLSTFIGSSPGYYKGTVNKDGTITGEIIGARGSQAFTGVPDENATLPDPYKLTYLKQGYTSLDFSFPGIDGKPVSLKDNKYKNKVVILTITGTWCPNCIDEAAFLAPWFSENKKRGVEAIAIHYERKNDTAYARKAISRFREKFGIEYDAVFAGIADKQQVAASLPALNSFLSFPTIIFIDKKGNVAKIHTGYSGPATGKYYEQFEREFNEEVDLLLKQ